VSCPRPLPTRAFPKPTMLVTSRPKMLFSLDVQHLNPFTQQAQRLLTQIGSSLQDRAQGQSSRRPALAVPLQSAEAAAKEAATKADSLSLKQKLPHCATCAVSHECVIHREIDKLRQFLCIEGQLVHWLKWHRTLLIGLDPSRNKDYSLRQLHVLLQLHDACTFTSGWHCLPYGRHETSLSTFHQLDRQVQLPGALSCDTM